MNANGIIFMLSSIFESFVESSYIYLLWLMVAFYLEFLTSLPVFSANLFQYKLYPGLAIEGVDSLLEIIFCA